MDEILNLSDRIAVINNGELVGLVDGEMANENEIGLMMAELSGVKAMNKKVYILSFVAVILA